MDAESKMGDPLDPDFYRCICEYDKARRNNAENFAEVKKTMFEAFAKTKLLVPIRERNGKMQSPALEGLDSVRATPVFTGLTAFEKIFNKDEWTLRVMDSIDLANVPHGYIVIDAATIAVRMSKQDILNIFRIVKSKFQHEDNDADLVETESKVIHNIFQYRAVAGKVPHSTSRPMICRYNDTYYIGAFTFFYTKEDIESGQVQRPCSVILADLKSGEIVGIFNTKDTQYEFSDASYDEFFDIRLKKRGKPDVERMNILLDMARNELINEGRFLSDAYWQYKELLLSDIPDSYKRFFEEFSV